MPGGSSGKSSAWSHTPVTAVFPRLHSIALHSGTSYIAGDCTDCDLKRQYIGLQCRKLHFAALQWHCIADQCASIVVGLEKAVRSGGAPGAVWQCGANVGNLTVRLPTPDGQHHTLCHTNSSLSPTISTKNLCWLTCGLWNRQ